MATRCLWVQPRQCAMLLLAAFATASCGGLLDFTSASFSGTEYPRQVPDTALKEAEVVPEGYLVIGHLSDTCQDEDTGLRDLLTKAPCGEDWLKVRMRQKAAEVGGTLMAGFRCTQSESKKTEKDSDGKEKTITTTTYECKASVGRSTDDTASGGVEARAPVRSAPQFRDVLSLQGESIEITFQGEPGRDARPALDPGRVEKVWGRTDDPGKLGQVTARCVTACSRAAVETGVVHGAARAGASRIADVACLQLTASSWQCTGVALQ